jgi:hypothetical protein
MEEIMYLDKQNLFSEEQAITAAANSTNVIDLGDEGGDGAGRKLVIVVTETFLTLVSLKIALHTAAVAAMTSEVVALEIPTILLAELVVGELFEIPIPAKRMQRFARLTFTPATDATAGAVTAGIVLDTQTNG